MNKEVKVKLSVIYSFALISLALYYGIYNILAYFSVSPGIYLVPLSIIALISFPLFFREKNIIFYSLIAILSFLIALGTMLIKDIHVPGDIMDAFILILVASLIASGVKDTFKLLYRGLSFFIVGAFLLFAFALIKIIIFLSAVLDYYINCLGDKCAPYSFAAFPSVALIILVIPALYPYFARSIFRRDVNDKESS